jgi:hypothetical protein
VKIEKVTWPEPGKNKVWHMRISETIVVQLVESDPPNIVLTNDLTGKELIILSADVKPILMGRWPSGDFGRAQIAKHIGEDLFDKLLDALAYFEQYM